MLQGIRAYWESEQQREKDRLASLRQTLLDTSNTDRKRAEAWQELSNRFPREASWTDELVRAAIHIGEASGDDRARELIWIGADGYQRSDLLVEPMIRALSDSASTVRQAAADALGAYKKHPGVPEALLACKENDESELVRRQAEAELNGLD